MKKKKEVSEKKDFSMFKRIGLIILFLIVICGVSYGGVVVVRNLNEKLLEARLNDEDFISDYVQILKDKSLGKNIYAVSKPSEVDIYDDVYREKRLFVSYGEVSGCKP